jgi:DNA-directed RNA polymerase subunit K/omega
MKLTQYEKARLIGARALQISMGAPILIKMKKKDYEKVNYDSIKIAKQELEKGVLPITIKKPMP